MQNYIKYIYERKLIIRNYKGKVWLDVYYTF